MKHELVALPSGSYSVKPLDSAEAMHSSIGPWEEAQSLYVGQTRLSKHLSQAGPPWVLYDVGMGIAANALAAIECRLDNAHARRDLHIVSFEKHPEGLELALDNLERFPWMSRHKVALHALIRGHAWEAPGVRWELREGDFREVPIDSLPRAMAIFYDFYFPKVHPELWSLACFEKLRRVSDPRAELVTYSASTAVRSALLLAGFYVGVGRSTAAKRQTTVAAACAADLIQPLGSAWLEKLARSEKPLPPDWPAGRREEAFERIRSFLAREEGCSPPADSGNT